MALVAAGRPLRGSDWETNFSDAKVRAAEQGKELLLCFTGSDWCGFCIALRDKVLAVDAFQSAVRDTFVLVELDYPQHAAQSEEVKSQNAELRQKFAVAGYPTLLLADVQGRPYARMRNQPGISPAQFAAQMLSLSTIRKERDGLIDEAQSLKGMERAEKLNEALEAMEDAFVERFYPELVDEIIALDENDKLKRKKNGKSARDLMVIEEKVSALAQDGREQEIAAIIDGFIKDKKLKGESRQRALMLKIGLFGTDKLAEAAVLLEEIVKIQSDSATGRKAQEMRSRVQQYQENSPISTAPASN